MVYIIYLYVLQLTALAKQIKYQHCYSSVMSLHWAPTKFSLLDIKACCSIDEQLWVIWNFLKIIEDNLKNTSHSE